MVFFIAEISSNHDQNIDRCIQLIDKAAEIGCDAVKFQLFKIDKLFAAEILRHRPEVAARKQWELPVAFLPLLAARCKEKNIQFSCTPFYLEAVAELEPYIAFYKIASYALLWDELLVKCAKTNKPIILSTGMATLLEVAHAVDILKRHGCEDLTLLHCVSAYPTPLAESNLAAINSLRIMFGCRVGWSDHTVQPCVLQRAIHRWGAEVIEFHFDLEGHGAEFKNGHCWLPRDIQVVINQIRNGFAADGFGIKEPAFSEMAERNWRTDVLDGLRPLLETRKAYL